MEHVPVRVILLVAFTLLITGSAEGQEDETRVIHVSAFSVGDLYWFEVEGLEGRNPPIPLRPGERVQVTLDNKANTGHNIRFGSPLNQEMPIQEPGKQDTLTFQIPSGADGETTYWCQPHRSLGMAGRIDFEAETEQAGSMGDATAVGLLMMIGVGIHRIGLRSSQVI